MQTIFFDISNKYAISMEPKPEGGNVALQFKQGNVGQKFMAVILDQEDPYNIPYGAQLSVWFSGPGGEGNYSDISDRSAFTVEGNTVTVEVIAQMLANPGNGTFCIILNSADGSQLGLWNVVYAVEHVPGMESKAAEDYYCAFSELARQAINAAATFETDKSLSVFGKAADAAAVGARVKKTAFTIPAGGAASIAFSGTANAMIYCRGWGSDMAAVLNYSGYAVGAKRQNLATIVNNGLVACGLNKDSAGQGLTIRNGKTDTALHVCIDSGLQDAAPVITYTADNAAELYVEYPNPPMALGVEYRTAERWNGKAVYTKLVNYGGMPNTNRYSVAHGAFPTQIVRCIGMNVTSGLPIPNDTASVFADKTSITIITTAHQNGGSAYVQIWYTKD